MCLWIGFVGLWLRCLVGKGFEPEADHEWLWLRMSNSL